MRNEVERARREGEEKAGQMRRQGEEELVKVKKAAEEKERKLHMEIKEALSKAEAKEERVEELTLINEHLQEQLAESRGNNDRLSGDVHRLSVSLSAAQNRASEMESEHRERLAELERANCGLRKMRERVAQVEGERERAGNEIKKTRDEVRRTGAELERVREEMALKDADAEKSRQVLKQQIEGLKQQHSQEVYTCM
ncbi:hypothetical protein GBAR_LOCUS23531 [Geodia barretti]|uniref:Uncharacterized protein n=1 Tax=Geodia barretti TaxID=519541 RepID=A0AA35T7P7_GEOBA|nr:hypothetical protein GBAR_LOCUS23531 [Geodia barretti]